LASMIRFVALAIFIGMTCLAPAFAEGMDTEQFKPVEPPSNLPRAQRGDKAQNLDRLFEALKARSILKTAFGRSGSRQRAIPPIC